MNNTYALVTGASSGLGKDFAEILAERGQNLILVARREDRLHQLKQELVNRHGISVTVIAKDLANPQAPQELYEEVAKQNLTVDTLINNAGYGIYGNFVDIPWSNEAAMMQLDMITLTHLTKLFTRDMVRRGKGYVMLVSSIGAYQASPTYASYAAAKSYVLHFGEALNYELRKTGVKVSVLSPGVTATEFLAVSGQDATLYQRLAMMKSRPVAEIGINAMYKGKPSVIPGLLNKLTAFTIRFTPRFMATRTAGILMNQNQAGKSSTTPAKA